MNLQNLWQENGMLSMIKITDYSEGNEDTTVKFETEVIKSKLQDYSDAYILVTGDITATGGDDARVAFKNCALFTKFIIYTNDEHVDNANNLDIIMPMYYLIEYSNNYSDTSGRLWQFKRDESPVTNAGNPEKSLQLIQHVLKTNQVS